MILSIQDVVKSYGNYQAVNHVSFDVPKGSVFGLLGPNGAGKTSLIRMITTITGPDSGAIYLDGEKLNDRSQEKIGYMPEERGLYKKMKVGDHLMYLAQLKGLSKQQAQQAIDHWLTLSAAKLLVILERNERGKQARRLFIMSEKRPAVQGGKAGLPGSYVAALRELANQVGQHRAERWRNGPCRASSL